MRWPPAPRTTAFDAPRALGAVFLGVALAIPSLAAAQPVAHPDTVAHAPADSAPPTFAAMLPETAAAAETLTAASRGVPVFLGGTQIFVVRASRFGLQPAARASAIRARLDVAVGDRDTPADSVHLRRTSDGVEVRLGRHLLWVITPEDVARMNVSELATLVAELPSRITRGVVKERAGRRPLGVLISVLIALGITVVAWVLWRLLRMAGRRWRAFLDRTLPKYLGGIRIGTFEVLSQGQLTGIVAGVLGRIGLVVAVVLLYGYLTAVFSLFSWSQSWSWRLLQFARDELIQALRMLGEAIPGLLIIAAIVLVFRWLTKISDRFFDAVHSGAAKPHWIHQELARPTKRLAKIALWIVAVAIAYPYIPGSQSKAVQGISILLGVMVSIGSSGFVGNIIAGIVLTYSRSFHPGDRVRIGEHIGDVVALGFFATKLRSVRNEEITVPNGQVASQPIVNYTRLAGEGLVLHTQVTIGYDADWRNVHALLIEAAGRVDGVEREPVPWVFQRSLNDHHITYELCCATHRAHTQLLLYSRLHEEIQDAFARAGVEILSPAHAALRDANAQVLPREPKGPRAEPGGFRIRPRES